MSKSEWEARFLTITKCGGAGAVRQRVRHAGYRCLQQRISRHSQAMIGSRPSRLLGAIGNDGAGNGNRTRVFSLEGCCTTIVLYPRSRRCRGLRPRSDRREGETGGRRCRVAIARVVGWCKSGQDGSWFADENRLPLAPCPTRLCFPRRRA